MGDPTRSYTGINFEFNNAYKPTQPERYANIPSVDGGKIKGEQPVITGLKSVFV
jgi:hypothetical protein